MDSNESELKNFIQRAKTGDLSPDEINSFVENAVKGEIPTNGNTHTKTTITINHNGKITKKVIENGVETIIEGGDSNAPIGFDDKSDGPIELGEKKMSHFAEESQPTPKPKAEVIGLLIKRTKCPYCGAKNKLHASFCNKCGGAL